MRVKNGRGSKIFLKNPTSCKGYAALSLIRTAFPKNPVEKDIRSAK